MQLHIGITITLLECQQWKRVSLEWLHRFPWDKNHNHQENDINPFPQLKCPKNGTLVDILIICHIFQRFDRLCLNLDSFIDHLTINSSSSHWAHGPRGPTWDPPLYVKQYGRVACLWSLYMWPVECTLDYLTGQVDTIGHFRTLMKYFVNDLRIIFFTFNLSFTCLFSSLRMYYLDLQRYLENKIWEWNVILCADFKHLLIYLQDRWKYMREIL